MRKADPIATGVYIQYNSMIMERRGSPIAKTGFEPSAPPATSLSPRPGELDQTTIDFLIGEGVPHDFFFPLGVELWLMRRPQQSGSLPAIFEDIQTLKRSYRNHYAEDELISSHIEPFINLLQDIALDTSALGGSTDHVWRQLYLAAANFHLNTVSRDLGHSEKDRARIQSARQRVERKTLEPGRRGVLSRIGARFPIPRGKK